MALPLSPGTAHRSSFDENDDDGEGGGRMAELLASYYGMEAKKQQADLTGDIDSATFDADGFVRQLLREGRQEYLLVKDEEMVREVKKLDSDMQMLVYENYNKFISATDTIRKMKQNVESMEVEMKSLQGSMEKISAASGLISASLADKRGEVDKLVRVRRLLSRLEFLFELPDILRSAIERGNVAQAIKYYSMTHAILKKHKHVSSFGAILRESEEIVATLKVRLEAKVDSAGVAQAPFVETVALLLRLKAPPPALRDKFITYHKRLFGEWFDSSRKTLIEDPSVTLESGMGQLTQGFLPMLLRTCKVYRHLFLTPGQPDNEEYSKPLAERIAAASVAQFFEQLTQKANATIAIMEAKGVAVSSGGDAPASADDDHEQTDEEEAASMKSLVTSLRQLQVDAEAFHAHLPEARLKQKAEAFSRSVKMRRAHCRFSAFCAHAGAQMAELLATVMDDVQVPRLEGVRSTYKRQTGYQLLTSELVLEVCKGLEQAMTSCLPLLSPGGEEAAAAAEGVLRAHIHRCSWQSLAWVRSTVEAFAALTQRGKDPAEILPGPPETTSSGTESGWSAASGHGTGAQAQLQQMQAAQAAGEAASHTKLLNSLSPLGPSAFPAVKLPQTPPEPSARVVLSLACLLREAATTMVPKTDALLQRHVPLPGRATQEYDAAISWHLSAGADSVLDYYVEYVGSVLAAGLRNGYASIDWANVPSSPGEATDAAISVVAGAERSAGEVAALLGEGNRSASVSVARGEKDLRRAGRSGAAAMGRKGVQLDIDRIFAGEICILSGGARFTADSVLGGVLKVVFKAAAEVVRLNTMSCGGYQQIQADVELLRQALPYYVTDSASVGDLDNLLDQVMMSAQDRALDVSQPLDSSALASVVARGLSKFK